MFLNICINDWGKKFSEGFQCSQSKVFWHTRLKLNKIGWIHHFSPYQCPRSQYKLLFGRNYKISNGMIWDISYGKGKRHCKLNAMYTLKSLKEFCTKFTAFGYKYCIELSKRFCKLVVIYAVKEFCIKYLTCELTACWIY